MQEAMVMFYAESANNQVGRLSDSDPTASQQPIVPRSLHSQLVAEHGHDLELAQVAFDPFCVVLVASALQYLQQNSHRRR